MSHDSPDETDRSKSSWIDDIHEHRRNAMEVRQEIPPDWADIAPFDVPELVDYYNRLLHQYASQLRPKRNVFRDLWTEELTTVAAPPSGRTVDLGTTNLHGEVDISEGLYELEWVERPVALANLRDTWRSNNQIRVTVTATNPDGTTRVETVQKTLALPPSAGDRVMDQLNECLEELGWLPDASEGEYYASDEEVLEH